MGEKPAQGMKKIFGGRSAAYGLARTARLPVLGWLMAPGFGVFAPSLPGCVSNDVPASERRHRRPVAVGSRQSGVPLRRIVVALANGAQFRSRGQIAIQCRLFGRYDCRLLTPNPGITDSSGNARLEKRLRHLISPK